MEEIHDLGQQLFRFVLPRHVIERDPRSGLHIDFCIALSELHELISAASTHLLHHLPREQLSQAPEDQDRDHDGDEHAQDRVHLFLRHPAELASRLLQAVYKFRIIKCCCFILLRFLTFIRKIDRISLKLYF